MVVDHAASILPYSERRDAIIDVFALPGGLIAAMFYPQGGHGGMGSPGYAYAAVAANWLFYALIWYVVIRSGPLLSAWVAGRRRDRP